MLMIALLDRVIDEVPVLITLLENLIQLLTGSLISVLNHLVDRIPAKNQRLIDNAFTWKCQLYD